MTANRSHPGPVAILLARNASLRTDLFAALRTDLFAVLRTDLFAALRTDLFDLPLLETS
jgi:hypothetical protein